MVQAGKKSDWIQCKAPYVHNLDIPRKAQHWLLAIVITSRLAQGICILPAAPPHRWFQIKDRIGVSDGDSWTDVLLSSYLADTEARTSEDLDLR